MTVRVEIKEIEKGTRLEFNNFNGYLDYLFRTDRDQRNSNSNTRYCLAILHIGEETFDLPFGELERRKNLKGVSEELVKAYGLNPDTLRITTTQIKIVDKKDKRVKVSYDELVELIMETINNRDDLYRCLFHVAHIDQSGYTIHNVFSW